MIVSSSSGAASPTSRTATSTSVSRGSRSTAVERPEARPGLGAGAEPAQGRSSRLRPLEGEQARRGHVVGLSLGPGRPGWHIECSVMSEKHLGPEFEIHGGGLDLVFPHHENEIAQSRSLGRRFARIWMHNGMLRFAGEEMHKSVGNDVSLKAALDGGVARPCSSSSSPGTGESPLDYSDATLEAARPAPKASATCFGQRASLRRTEPGSGSRQRSTTTSIRPPRSRSCTSGATTSFFAARSRSSASSRSPRRSEAPDEVVALAEQRIEARACARLRPGGPPA